MVIPQPRRLAGAKSSDVITPHSSSDTGRLRRRLCGGRPGACEARAGTCLRARWDSDWSRKRRNEPDSGWRWRLPTTTRTLAGGYLLFFDACGAGVADAELHTGLNFALAGPASGRGRVTSGSSRVFQHYSTGRNLLSGPVRLDTITLHAKRKGTS